MLKTSPDHPNVIVFPPIILATTVILGCMLQWAWPLGAFAALSQAWRVPIGCGFIVGGISLAVAGRRMLKSLGTNISPLQPTTVLATGGVYGWTRNPLYSGGTLIMLGIALIFAVDWLALLIVPSLLVLHFGVVSREEQYLEEKFGAVYRAYKTSVSRYGMGI
jgi:protein-S-isoprenylcysteine O-methyltransferase Ste14